MRRALIALAVTIPFLLPALACRAGMVSLTFDDGLRSVYRYAFPVLKRYGLPATVGIIASRMESGDDDFMPVDEVKALQDAGWEVASHSLTHKRPVDIPRYYTEERCLKLRPIHGRRGVYEAKYKYEELAGLTENGRLLREHAAEKAVRREPGSYYFDELIGQVIVHPYSIENVRKEGIRAVSYERELEESKKLLEGSGLKVTTYITPHNYWTPEMSELSRRFYGQVADGGDGMNRKGATDRYWLRRFVVHTSDPAETIIGLIKEHAIRENGWVILCLHGVGDDIGWEPWSAEKLAKLAAFLKDEAVPVVTLDKGVKIWVEGKGRPGI